MLYSVDPQRRWALTQQPVGTNFIKRIFCHYMPALDALRHRLAKLPGGMEFVRKLTFINLLGEPVMTAQESHQTRVPEPVKAPGVPEPVKAPGPAPSSRPKPPPPVPPKRSTAVQLPVSAAAAAVPYGQFLTTPDVETARVRLSTSIEQIQPIPDVETSSLRLSSAQEAQRAEQANASASASARASMSDPQAPLPQNVPLPRNVPKAFQPPSQEFWGKFVPGKAQAPYGNIPRTPYPPTYSTYGKAEGKGKSCSSPSTSTFFIESTYASCFTSFAGAADSASATCSVSKFHSRFK